MQKLGNSNDEIEIEEDIQCEGGTGSQVEEFRVSKSIYAYIYFS